MKFVNKGAEPQDFTDWKYQASVEWQPSYESLSGSVKNAVKNALMIEQGYICCYCEVRINDNNSHIEHIKPQFIYKRESLDYSNMLCSCLKETKKGDPLHCGFKKENWYVENYFVSPLDPDCEERFGFTGNGVMFSKDNNDAGATETIKRLGLNIPKLIALRKSAIYTFIEIVEEETHNKQFLTAFTDSYISRDEEGKFGEFCTAIRYISALLDRNV